MTDTTPKLKRSDMRGYQTAMVDAALSSPKIANYRELGVGAFASMGAGKTAVIATIVAELLELGEVRRVLIVSTKANALVTWPREFLKWDHLWHIRTAVCWGTVEQRMDAVRLKYPVTICTYESFLWLVSECAYHKKWPFCGVFFDESTAMKNADSRRHSLYFMNFTKKTPYVGLSTGTPAPQGYQDLWGQLRLLDGGRRLGLTHTAFAQKYCKPAGFMGKGFTVKDDMKPVIREDVSDICYWIDATEHLDVGEERKNFIEVPLAKDLRDLYYQLEEEFILELEEGVVDAANAAVLSGKLRQFCNGSILNEEGEALWVHEEKYYALEELIENVGGMPIIVAAYFRTDIERIAQLHPDAEIFCAGDGDQLDRFNDGQIPLLVGGEQPMSRGIDLQDGSNTTVWFGMTWSGERYLQLNARAGPVRQAQSGNNRGSIVHHIVIEDSIEQKIMRRLARNISDQEALTDFIKLRT